MPKRIRAEYIVSVDFEIEDFADEDWMLSDLEDFISASIELDFDPLTVDCELRDVEDLDA